MVTKFLHQGQNLREKKLVRPTDLDLELGYLEVCCNSQLKQAWIFFRSYFHYKVMFITAKIASMIITLEDS